MTKDELQQLLDIKGVPKSTYNLDGIKAGECLCILHDDQLWSVVYNSRGIISFREDFEKEEDAYKKFFEIMKKGYHWDD